MCIFTACVSFFFFFAYLKNLAVFSHNTEFWELFINSRYRILTSYVSSKYYVSIYGLHFHVLKILRNEVFPAISVNQDVSHQWFQPFRFILTQFSWTIQDARMAKLTLRDILNISCPQDTAGLCLLINMSFRRICLTLKKPYTLDLQFYQRTVCRAVWVPQYMSQPYEAHVLLIVCLGCVFSNKVAPKFSKL